MLLGKARKNCVMNYITTFEYRLIDLFFKVCKFLLKFHCNFSCDII
mgnify:CR=1 FL=1